MWTPPQLPHHHPFRTILTLNDLSFVRRSGLFVLEPVAKGQFVIEYIGEYITQNEADRRGLTYNKAHSNFMFEVNDGGCVDSFRQGNRSKFANVRFSVST